MTIRYEFDNRPDAGKTMAVADGVQWLRMPLPFALNHINLWLLRDDPGWAIVDTGVGTEETQQVWATIFTEAMSDAPATHIIATHMHPDHVGCAGWLARKFAVDLWMTRDEYMMCRILVADTGRDAPAEGLQFYAAAGFSQQQLERYRKFFGFFGKFVTPIPEAFKRMADRDVLDIGGASWEVITGGGHSPEHACLYDGARNILISGDQLLPSISSNVSVWPTEPLANPLREWFRSLRNLKDRVPADVLVLPSHGKPFRGAHERLDDLIRDHEEKLASLLDWCKEPRQAVDVFPALYKARIDDKNRIMATGEALAHLHYLVGRGDLTAEPDSKHVVWYRTAFHCGNT
ncbi:MAG: MBL fold metallo-hydrolase [Proteobacteria bacterium]|nr:MBL fold metallo-hydrolase [Pseudomonadota bacterium]MCH8277378.1 MBL fold metallo-hydrolase [Pseudomonadota bacterium]